MSVQICQMIRGVLSGMKNIYFIKYFVQSKYRNYPVLNTRVRGAGRAWVVFARRCLSCVCPLMSDIFFLRRYIPISTGMTLNHSTIL